MPDLRDDTLKQIGRLSKAHTDALMEFAHAVEREQFILFNSEVKVIFTSVYSDLVVMLAMCATLVNCIKNEPTKESEVSNGGSSNSE